MKLNLAEIKKRPVLRGVLGQRRLSDAEKREMGRLVNTRAYTVQQLAKRTRCSESSIRMWAEKARLNGLFADTFEKHAPKIEDVVKADAAIKRLQKDGDFHSVVYAGTGVAGEALASKALDGDTKSEANGNGHYDVAVGSLRLTVTREQAEEAILAWVRSKGIQLESLR